MHTDLQNDVENLILEGCGLHNALVDQIPAECRQRCSGTTQSISEGGISCAVQTILEDVIVNIAIYTG